MKITNIKKIPITLLVTLLSLTAFTGVILAAPSRTSAATPALCNTFQPDGNHAVTECSSANMPENLQKFLGGASDKCFTVRITNSVGPTVKTEPDCNHDPFDGFALPGRNNQEFNQCQSSSKDDTNCVSVYINKATQFLSAGVGIIVIVMVIIAGIQYSTAGGDPQKVAAARTKIFNAILALVAFIFLFAFLQWLLPGGWL
jgi:hypothetical protein